MPRKKKSNNTFNKFFDKIFVINLFDKTTRWNKVEKQFKNRKINIDRFIAVDGRCQNQGKKACLEKLKSFEISYNVRIDPKAKNKHGDRMKVTEILPASSLTLGTLLLLRAQVKNGWKTMLLCEDDIELTRDIDKKLKQGIKELGNRKWDLLYLGCGGLCGDNGLSWKKDEEHQYPSTFQTIYKGDEDYDFYVSHPNDLRDMCEDNRYCEYISEHITKLNGGRHGGTWCYAWSLEGAKKMLKVFEKNKNKVSVHIDHFNNKQVKNGTLKAYSFNPVIVHHEKMTQIRDSDIPWEW